MLQDKSIPSKTQHILNSFSTDRGVYPEILQRSGSTDCNASSTEEFNPVYPIQLGLDCCGIILIEISEINIYKTSTEMAMIFSHILLTKF